MTNTNLSDDLNRLESLLVSCIEETPIPAENIKKAIHYSLFPGGKRMRPALVYLTGHLLNIPNRTLDTIAIAIELIHTYSLVHDDLPAMDNDDYRRGKLSCHRAFNEATAILVGDALQALALDILFIHLAHALEPHRILKIAHELVRACGPSGMVSGQSLDLSELANPAISEQKLRTIHHLKTGCLISACINMVLLATEPSPEAAQALKTFAYHLGLVFQMQDDFLDHYDDAHLKKARASDMANQKITFATLYSKQTLLDLIQNTYQTSLGALSLFDSQSHDLIEFTQSLFAHTLSFFNEKNALTNKS